ncbi:hypothetical protein F4776DRAFT_659232 [Hypoxylon sp. NC0597]|nr:hypothetical protein F4776DRAFT_659232 [Hypoxylon sp. NC0597]
MARLRGEDEVDAIRGDITKIVHARIDGLICQGLPVEILRGIEAELLMEAGASWRELDALLRNRNIYDIYNELLAARSVSQKARKALMIMLAARY